MSDLEALLLGLVQGLTEFLPVSSSGHLVIGQALLGVKLEGVLFEVAVHVATLGSVLLFYHRRVWELLTGVLVGRPEALAYVAKLVVGTLPAVVAVLLAGGFFEAQFESARSAALGLLATGGILWTTRWTLPRARAAAPDFRAALLIGCAQALAILPGVSRSGSTVAAALALGIAPIAAAEFSFLLSVLAITGAAARMLTEVSGVPPGQTLPLLLSGAVALASGVAAIWVFVRLLRTSAFHRFAFYTWTVGLLTLAYLATR